MPDPQSGAPSTAPAGAAATTGAAAPALRFVLHVGMGKTGTSAIQAALQESGPALQAQGARYLGMDFRLEGLDSTGWDGLRRLAALPPDERARHAAAYVEGLKAIAAQNGLSTFILSNEAMSGMAPQLLPFLTELARVMDLRVLAWARDPAGWLPSAHAQWAVRHKLMPGPVEPMSISGRRLVGYYYGILEWQQQMPGAFSLRPYRRDMDIVADFAAAAGITLPARPQAVYRRPGDAELLLRAIFNDTVPGEALPDDFEKATGSSRSLDNVPRLQNLARRVLDYSEAAEIIDEHSSMFDDVAAATGVELRGLGGETVPEMPPQGQLRGQLIEHLAALTMDQARRIIALENGLARCEQRLKALESAQSTTPHGLPEAVC